VGFSDASVFFSIPLSDMELQLAVGPNRLAKQQVQFKAEMVTDSPACIQIPAVSLLFFVLRLISRTIFSGSMFLVMVHSSGQLIIA
jgi:hypothetical protein